MYSELPPDNRDHHPYHMYEEIWAQPAAAARSISLVLQEGADICAAIAAARRVFVTGCGTSYHAALGGAWLLRTLSRGTIEVAVMQAHDLVTYVPEIRPDDVVIGVSHSGTSFMTLAALERAKNSGADSILLTGFPQSPGAQVATRVLPTGYGEERSWAHTVSYTAALATMAAIGNALALEEDRLDLDALPDVLKEALGLEDIAHRMAAGLITAERYREPSNIVLVGPGPNEATAHEGVLKLLETSFVEASGFGTEQMLHGPLAAVGADTLFIVIAPPGLSTARSVELVNAVRQLDIVPVVLTGQAEADRFDNAHRLILPAVPETLSPIPYVVPLQFFSYFLSIGKSINPDLIHRDAEPYRLAAKQYR